MKKILSKAAVLLLCIAMLSVGYAIGATGKIHTEYSRPNVYVDGAKIDYTYADGTKANAFMSTEWVTYMPVRAIAEALGKEVTTEGTNVYIKSADATVSGDVLYEDELVKIVFIGIGENSIFDCATIKLCCENKSDTDFIIWVEDLSVNGFTITEYFNSTVLAGKKANSHIDLHNNSTDKDEHIYTVENFELKFEINDADTGNTIKTTDAISATVS